MLSPSGFLVTYNIFESYFQSTLQNILFKNNTDAKSSMFTQLPTSMDPKLRIKVLQGGTKYFIYLR